MQKQDIHTRVSRLDARVPCLLQAAHKEKIPLHSPCSSEVNAVKMLKHHTRLCVQQYILVYLREQAHENFSLFNLAALYEEFKGTDYKHHEHRCIS